MKDMKNKYCLYVKVVNNKEVKMYHFFKGARQIDAENPQKRLFINYERINNLYAQEVLYLIRNGYAYVTSFDDEIEKWIVLTNYSLHIDVYVQIVSFEHSQYID